MEVVHELQDIAVNRARDSNEVDKTAMSGRGYQQTGKHEEKEIRCSYLKWITYFGKMESGSFLRPEPSINVPHTIPLPQHGDTRVHQI